MKSKCSSMRPQMLEFYNQYKDTMSIRQMAIHFNVDPKTMKYNINEETRNIKIQYMHTYSQLPHVLERTKTTRPVYHQRAKDRIKNNPILKEEKRKRKQLLRLRPKTRISDNMRSRIIMSIKNKFRKDYKTWESIVGYTKHTLIKHLESQFEKNMSWDNYGLHGWHIDHILPVNMFNYNSFEHPHFKMCWCLENLRPIWGYVNMCKYHHIPTDVELEEWFTNDLQRLNTLKCIKNEVLNGKTK